MDLTRISWTCFFFLAVFIYASAQQRDKRAPCPINCSRAKKRQVCGSDGVTYPSKCELRKAKKCDRKRVSEASKGPCPDKSGLKTKCLLERESAKQSSGAFVPSCNPDGTYSKTQHHPPTGFYWCVDPSGAPISGTSSSTKIKDCETGGNPRSCPGCKGCSSKQRTDFNKNLIDLFSEEFSRIPRPTSKIDPHGIFPDGLPIRAAEEKSILASPEKKVIEWKFTELDNDKDGTLKSRELKSLKKMVRQVMKPKACAKTFVNYCDLNGDGGIKRKEWSLCLGVDFKGDEQPRFKANERPLGTQIRRVLEDLETGTASGQDRRDPNDDSFHTSSSGPTLGNRQRIGLKPGRRKDPADERGSDNEDKLNDCNEERRVAEEANKANPASGIYIPRCQDNGKYRKEQCHDSTSFCWCANENTGRPIPGTATHKVMPVCDGKPPRKGGKKTPKNAYKGCPTSAKAPFLQELLDTLTAEMMSYLHNGSTDPRKRPEDNPDYSLEERVVRWKLVMLDKNNNKVIDKKERKRFKKEIRKHKKLRKCGRNFVNYCDADRNKKITADELVKCMGLKDDDVIGDEPAAGLPLRHKMKGKNPFSTYLKG